MTNPDTQDTEGLALAGRIELHPLRETRALAEIARGEYEHRQPRVRRAPNPDGRSWRAEDESVSAHDDTQVWFATERDTAFVLHLCKRFRDNEFFFVPDESIRRAVTARQIIAFSYRALEAGYIWVTFPANGRSRINQLAVDEQLWRNKVGTTVVDFFECEVLRRGGWSAYLSCNSNTPGHSFWPQVGYSPIIEKEAGRRGGKNLIWAKILDAGRMLFPVTVGDVKGSASYRFQSSVSDASRARRLLASLPPSNVQGRLFSAAGEDLK